MPQVLGEVTGHTEGVRAIHIGCFPDRRVSGHPVAWTRVQGPGPFQMEVPPGSWYLHAVAGPTDEQGFLSGIAWGSWGGIYGYGRPLVVPADTGANPGAGADAAVAPSLHPPLPIHISPLWRDLTHVPRHRQPPLPDHQWASVHRVIAALGQDLGNPEGDNLPAVAGLARTRLSALFKRATGLTMVEYRTRLRLEAARALLVETDLDVLTIALEVGYSTAAQMGRMFRRYLGVSPGHFRRLARQVQAGGPVASLRTPEPGRLRSLLHQVLPGGRGATVQGEVIHRGAERGVVIYLCAFPGPFPETYPAAWCALPGPGPFTLRGIPPGRHYILAVYCRRRMRYPGDFHTAFAYGGYGDLDTTGHDPWNPVPLDLQEGDFIGGLTVELTPGDRAAAYARPWIDAFLPDGR